MQRTAAWRLVIHSYPCPTCGAAPGQWCETKNGRQTDMPHAARGDTAETCAKCGARLPAGSFPGELCPHCQLVRDLEVERATKYRRTDP